MSEFRFDNRVAAITGAGRGLGRTYALLLASKGAKVIVTDTGTSLRGDGSDVGVADEVVREIKAAGGDAIACTESVATPEGGAAIIKAALDHYGRLDILVHSAGIVRDALLKAMTQEDFDTVTNVHYRGAFHVVRPAFSQMCTAGYGRLVLVSSIIGLYGFPGLANYAAAKTGMIGLCNGAATEGAAEGVKCNIIVPSAMTRMADGFDTQNFPPMTTDQVAPAVGWLAHETCSITGEILIAIAGRIARAAIAESRGIYQPAWTIEQVGEQMDAIRNMDAPLLFSATEGRDQHVRYSFGMVTGTAATDGLLSEPASDRSSK